MKYKVGDRVRIKSLDWYNENKNEYGNVNCPLYVFSPTMRQYCGTIRTIKRVDNFDKKYKMEEDGCFFDWTDEMIEGLVEEEIKSEPKFHIGDWATDGDVLAEDSCIFIIQKLGDNGTAAKTYCALHNDGDFENGSILYFDIDSTKPATEEEKQKLFKAIKDNGYKWNSETKTLEKLIEPLDVPTMTTEFVKEHGLPCPEGYIFKDENGNVINATKIVLEKKKKEYPKSYEECCEVLNVAVRDFDILYNMLDTTETIYTNNLDRLLNSFRKLLICRDAYWKIAGDEMGLGKPWEPDYDSGVDKFGIICMDGVVQDSNPTTNWERHLNKVFDFPNKEMRDAFKKNFDKDLELCKEFL